MKTSQDGKNDLGAGVTVEFKVTEKNGKVEAPASKIWFRGWGQTVSRKTDWVEWLVTFNNGKEENIRYKDVDFGDKPGSFTTDYAVVGCENAKMELDNSVRQVNGEKWIRNREIKFWVNEEKCQKTDNSVTCDLLFKPESKLKWKSGFNPRITFSK